MKPTHVHIIPAQPGYTAVFLDETGGDREVWADDVIIAWRIETHEGNEHRGLFSHCTPMTVEGDVGANCVGVQQPDGTVVIFEHSTFETLEAYRVSLSL